MVKQADILIYVQHCADNTSNKLSIKIRFLFSQLKEALSALVYTLVHCLRSPASKTARETS